jgi:hypothetical protein
LEQGLSLSVDLVSLNRVLLRPIIALSEQYINSDCAELSFENDSEIEQGLNPAKGHRTGIAIAAVTFHDPKFAMKLITVVVSVLFVTSIATRAELPPQVYKEYQARSPEVLTIKVNSVTVTKADAPDGTRSDIAAQASIEAIERSATHLHVGDTIPVKYSHYTYKHPIAGPGQPEIIVQGRTYLAYLARSDKEETYVLAAGGRSFCPLKAK